MVAFLCLAGQTDADPSQIEWLGIKLREPSSVSPPMKMLPFLAALSLLGACATTPTVVRGPTPAPREAPLIVTNISSAPRGSQS